MTDNHLALAAQFHQQDIVERLRAHGMGSMLRHDAANEIERLRDALRAAMALDPGVEADAARWRYVRDHLTQGIGPHMDGTWQFRFLSLFERGQTVAEAIDTQIAKLKGSND